MEECSIKETIQKRRGFGSLLYELSIFSDYIYILYLLVILIQFLLFVLIYLPFI